MSAHHPDTPHSPCSDDETIGMLRAEKEIAEHMDALMQRLPVPEPLPYYPSQALEQIMEWVSATCCRQIDTKEERREFWRLLDAVLNLWDDVPFVMSGGMELPVSNRRQVSPNIDDTPHTWD